MVILPEVYVTLAEFGYHVMPFGSRAPKDFQVIRLSNLFTLIVPDQS